MTGHSMTGQSKRRPGQPIIVFFALLLCWTGMRVAVWESPFPQIAPFDLAASLPRSLSGAAENGAPAIPAAAQGEPGVWPYQAGGLISPPRPVAVDIPVIVPIPSAATGSAGQSEVIASHQLLFLAAMGHVPVPAEVAKIMREGPARTGAQANSSGPKIPRTGKRWSMDGWLFLRPDATLAANSGSRFASYGASQAGAVLRYRLKPGSAARPAAYVRATTALAAGRESEIAAGLSARLVPGVPIAAHAELRVTRGAATTEIRPAAFAVTEISPIDLPLGLRAETYVAAGYVGGDFATAFVDGQARVDRELIHFDLGSIRAGAGAWGGAQKGAARLDVGPSASLNVKLGAVPARVAVDYRLRAAGDAEPGSGVAVTLTTGF